MGPAQRTSSRLRLTSAVATIALLLPALFPTASGASPEADLARAREAAKAVTRELESARGEADQRRDAAAETARRVAQLEEAVNDAARAVDRQQAVVRDREARVAAAEAEADRIRTALTDRARQLYMRRTPNELAPLLSGGDMLEVLDGIATMGVLTNRDHASVEQLHAVRDRVAEERARLAEELARLEKMRAEREALLAETEKVLAQRRAALATAEAEVSDLTSRKEDLEEESAQIEALIAARRAAEEERRRREAAAAAAAAAAAEAAARSAPPAYSEPAAPSAGGYIWPFCGYVTSEYGYRWGRRHEGIDIDGNTGDTLRAAKAGTVIFVGWQGGYGRLTLIDHGDGIVTAYAHQSAQYVTSGQSVPRGHAIGAMGNTGNSTGSHLHFETRTRNGPVNPRRYLPSSC